MHIVQAGTSDSGGSFIWPPQHAQYSNIRPLVPTDLT